MRAMAIHRKVRCNWWERWQLNGIWLLGSRGVVTQSYSGRRYVGTVVEPHAYVKENETELASEKTITRENYWGLDNAQITFITVTCPQDTRTEKRLEASRKQTMNKPILVLRELVEFSSYAWSRWGTCQKVEIWECFSRRPESGRGCAGETESW